jgi:phage tail sheath gpL-like
MSIQFNQIPVNWQVPGVYAEVDNSGAVQGTPAQRKPVLLVGMRTSAGTIAEAIVKPITAASQGITYFGQGSQLAHMIERFIQTNPNAELYAVALDEDAAGVKATCTLTVTGTATEDGTIALLVGGRKVNVGVTNGDVQNAIGAAIDDALDLEADLAVTAADVDNVVTLSARHKGVYGNSLSVQHSYYTGQKLPAGVALAITAFASGATDPDIADAIAAIPGVQYYTVVTGFTADANMDTLELELEDRWGPMQAIPGHAIAAVWATYADSQTYGNARNSAFSTVLATGKSPTPPWECASILAAVEVAENDPARPRQNRKLPRMLPPVIADRFTLTERNLLLLDGMATYKIDADECYIERMVTTFQTTGGIADPSYHDIETLRTLAFLRHSLVTRFALRYPNAKLANDGTNFGPGQIVVTPKIARGEVLALFDEWELAGLVEGRAQFAAQLIVERNADNPNQLDMFLPPDLINQLRVTAAQIGYKL